MKTKLIRSSNVNEDNNIVMKFDFLIGTLLLEWFVGDLSDINWRNWIDK